MISMSFGLCVAVLMQFISNFVVGIFTVDTMVIHMGSQYIRSYIWDCIYIFKKEGEDYEYID